MSGQFCIEIKFVFFEKMRAYIFTVFDQILIFQKISGRMMTIVAGASSPVGGSSFGTLN